MGKEKIGIEKLIELLNEYENTDNWENRYQVEFRESKIISKKFGFIKWLVENDKINTESGPLYGFHFIMHNRQPYSLYETILMILAISDTPIEDLISYLK